ncbi:F-box domain containing protein [Tanacetum coccineum]
MIEQKPLEKSNDNSNEVDMKMLKEKIHVIQVSYEICKGAHLTQECPVRKEDKTFKHIKYIGLLEETINKYCEESIKRQAANDERIRKFIKKYRLELKGTRRYNKEPAGWNITIKDVEKRRQILIPTIHTLPNLELVVQPYMPLSPFPDEAKVLREEEHDYIPLQDFVEFRVELFDITGVDEKADGNSIKDVKELSGLFSDFKGYEFAQVILDGSSSLSRGVYASRGFLRLFSPHFCESAGSLPVGKLSLPFPFRDRDHFCTKVKQKCCRNGPCQGHGEHNHKEDATDRISELPDGIIENILLRLDKPKERVRVSVLSKKWFALTASLPVLKFLFWDFVDEDWNSDNFYQYVKHTVSRFCRHQNVKIAHTFKLLTLVEDNTKLDFIDKCVELILLRGVKALDICFMKSRFSICPPMYCLPNILSSMSTLTSLKISDCVMLPSSLMVGVVNLKSLKVLGLTRVPLNLHVIKRLSASCPLLEELVVECCYGLTEFCVDGRLQNLKKLRFIGYKKNGIETIDIEAPNLCECLLSVGQGRGATSVILDSCKQLRTLYLDGPFFPTLTGFSDFLSNFPFLENLSLCLVNRRNILAVSSPSLRNFMLYDECDLEEIDINTPNLRVFSFTNRWNCSKGEFIRESDSRELKTCLECHIINKVDTLWLLKIRRYLEKANKFKCLKLNNLFGMVSVDSELLKGTQLPPYELDHVELKMPIRHMLPVLDGLLWCFRPRSLSLTSGFSGISDEERSHFVKCISERLIQQEDQGPTNIRIEWSLPSKAKIYFSWSSMLTASCYEVTQTLTFKKEEGPDTDQGFFPPGCNSNFIALIPKIHDAKVIKDFRPISLIGSIYKIIAKILANRLCTVIPLLINEVQTAFVADRQILDGPFILNELFSWCKHKKKKAMIFKIDFEKAFDSVRWDYLDDILKSFGFGDKWRRWIAGCLNSAKGSVLVNRSPTLEFKFHRGLKQGDPLSPFLFILVMESLHHDAVFVGEWNRTNIITIVRELWFREFLALIDKEKDYPQWAEKLNLVILRYLFSSESPEVVLVDLDGSGNFTVNSVRSYIDDMLLPKSDTPTRWVKLIPIKINILAWKISLDCLPTRFILSSRGLEIDSLLCPVCNASAETSSHSFFACSLARNIMRNICYWWELDVVSLNSYSDWIIWLNSIRLNKYKKEILEGICLVSWWFIWYFRNQIIFGKVLPKKDLLFDNIVQSSFFWISNRCKDNIDWVSWLKNPNLLPL